MNRLEEYGYAGRPLSRLQSMAVFDEILGAEKAQILGASAQNSCQVQSVRELRGQSNKIVLKTMKIRALGADLTWEMKAGAPIFF